MLCACFLLQQLQINSRSRGDTRTRAALPSEEFTRLLELRRRSTSTRHTGKYRYFVFRSSIILNDLKSRDQVESHGQFAQKGRTAGNENRRWHGTRRECTLGDKGNTSFCNSTTCSLCCILKTSFDLAFFKKKTSWGRLVKPSPCSVAF